MFVCTMAIVSKEYTILRQLGKSPSDWAASCKVLPESGMPCKNLPDAGNALPEIPQYGQRLARHCTSRAISCLAIALLLEENALCGNFFAWVLHLSPG